jgi:hypothetical protein
MDAFYTRAKERNELHFAGQSTRTVEEAQIILLLQRTRALYPNRLGFEHPHHLKKTHDAPSALVISHVIDMLQAVIIGGTPLILRTLPGHASLAV